MLFASQLFFTLPYFIPSKEPILFECVLGENCTKMIELENSSSKVVTYFVRYEGSSDFVIDETNPIKIEAKSQHKFKVSFVSRVT